MMRGLGTAMLQALALGYRAALLAASATGFVSFSYIAVLLSRLARLGVTRQEYVAGFLLLALSHAWAPFMLDAGPKVAYTAYTATASFAAAGFLLLAGSRRRRAYALAPIAVPIGFDLFAAVSAVAAATRFQRKARILVLVIGLAFALRAVGVAAATKAAGTEMLLAAELLRATTAALLAASYAATTRRG